MLLVWHFGARACNWRSTSTVHLRPPHISKTIRARKLKFYIQLGRVRTLFWFDMLARRTHSSILDTYIFPLGGVQGVQHPYCTKCTVVFAASLARLMAEKWYPKRVYDPALLYVKFQLSSSNSFGDMRRVPILYYGVLRPWEAPCEKFSPTTKRVFDPA